MLSEEDYKKLQEIATKLNTTVEKLLSESKNPKEIIEKYESGNFRMLNE